MKKTGDRSPEFALFQGLADQGSRAPHHVTMQRGAFMRCQERLTGGSRSKQTSEASLRLAATGR